MILAFHCVFTTYGSWLPNEPRGSWSRYVANQRLYEFGPATTVHTSRSLAHRPFDRDRKSAMQDALQHAPVRLTNDQISVVGESFADLPYEVHSLAVMPSHLHTVISRTERDIRQVIGHLKSHATRALRAHGWFTERSPWTRQGWVVYLNDDEAVERAIEYVRRNPARDGLPAQNWSFLVPFTPPNQI